MSDYTLIFAPTNPYWQPTPEAADTARRLLQDFTPEREEDVRVQFFDPMTFENGMGNWSGVHCPSCESDVEDWFWREAQRVFDNQFSDLTATTDCCGKTLSLNDLAFDTPAAFCRFALKVLRPGVDTGAAQQAALEKALGCSLRKIWERF